MRPQTDKPRNNDGYGSSYQAQQQKVGKRRIPKPTAFHVNGQGKRQHRHSGNGHQHLTDHFPQRIAYLPAAEEETDKTGLECEHNRDVKHGRGVAPEFQRDVSGGEDAEDDAADRYLVVPDFSRCRQRCHKWNAEKVASERIDHYEDDEQTGVVRNLDQPQVQHVIDVQAKGKGHCEQQQERELYAEVGQFLHLLNIADRVILGYLRIQRHLEIRDEAHDGARHLRSYPARGVYCRAEKHVEHDVQALIAHQPRYAAKEIPAGKAGHLPVKVLVPEQS